VLDLHENNNVQQYNFWGGLRQRWRARKNDDGTVHIITAKGDRCLDVPGGNQNPGTNMQIWDVQNDNNNQKYILVPVGQDPATFNHTPNTNTGGSNPNTGGSGGSGTGGSNPNTGGSGGSGTGGSNPNTNTGGSGTGGSGTGVGSSFKVTEKISFPSAITTNSGTLVEINHYRRQFTLDRAQAVQITLHIPFVGNDTGGKRSRIQLRVGNDAVCDSTKFNTNSWELHEVTLTALVDLGAGQHTMSVWACVDGGTLQIPHYNAGLIEHTVQSPIFANLFMFGLGF